MADGRAVIAAREADAASLRVVRRFAVRCGLIAAVAAAEWLCGFGFLRPLGLLALGSSGLCLYSALRNRERVFSPFWTSFDEAMWLLSVGSVCLPPAG